MLNYNRLHDESPFHYERENHPFRTGVYRIGGLGGSFSLERQFAPLQGFVAQILARDSRSESRLVTGSDEQAEAHALPNDELVHLQRGAEEAWITDGVV